MKTYAFSCVIWLLAANLALADKAKDPDVIGELKIYYKEQVLPPCLDAIQNLSADKAEQRATAAKYLVALLGQALADELSGKAPWLATPFWGQGSENPARELRGRIAEELSKAPASEETLIVLRWYLDHEKMAAFQKQVLPALDGIKGNKADAFCLSLLQPVHENAAVVFVALEQAGKRKIAIPEAVLKSLCDHYRPSLRDAARKLNKERGGADPGPFDGAAAMQRPAIAALMVDIGKVLDRPAPPNAPFVKVTSEWKNGKNSGTDSTLGWLVTDNGDSWIILTPLGQRQSFQKETKIKRADDDEFICKSAWEKYPIADEIKRVVNLRKKGDPEFELSARGGLSGQFEGHGIGLVEVTLAHWLYTAKQFDQSAQVFLPALDTLYLDRHVVHLVRDRVGVNVGHRMLAAFVGDRDFAEAQRLAELILNRYPNTRFHTYALKFSKELPRRQDDFKKLKLPTPEEWAALKKKLNRTEQIAFLAERMRLINCFQHSQPGGCSISEPQYAEPCGISDDAAWGRRLGKTKVINPYIELRGERERDRGTEDAPLSKGMELTVADIPQLAPYLRDDWFMLCVSFWRSFTPERSLDSTRPLFGAIIDDLAKRHLCHIDDMDTMSVEDIDKQIDKIVRWGKENASKTERDLLWENLDQEVKAGTPWGRLRNPYGLIELKDKRMLTVLSKYLDTTESEYDLDSILYACLEFDPSSFKDAARKFARHSNVKLRVAAGYILYSGGERDEGRKVFADIMENGSPWKVGDERILKLVETLLNDETKESKQTARLIFKNARYAEIHYDWVRVSLVNQCAKAGIGDGHLSYLPLLDIQGSKIGNIGYGDGTHVCEVIADEITTRLAPTDPEIIRIKKDFPKAADQIAPLKEWLKAKAKALANP